MQSTNLRLALLLSLVNCALAVNSPRVLHDLEALPDNGMVEVQFEPVDPEDAIGDEDAIMDQFRKDEHAVALETPKSMESTMDDGPSGLKNPMSFFDEVVPRGRPTKTLSDRLTGGAPGFESLVEEAVARGRPSEVSARAPPGFEGFLEEAASRGRPSQVTDDRPGELEIFFDEPANHGRASNMMMDDSFSGASGPPDFQNFLDEAAAHGRPPMVVSDGPLGPQDLEAFFDQAISTSQNLRGHNRGNGFRSMSARSPPEDTVMVSGGMPISSASVSASTLRSLFPGPGMMIEEDGPPMPFGSPDMAIMDMLQQMDESFTRDMLPMAHRASSMGKTPDSCVPEIREYCGRSPSPLHCLGQNSDKISDKCREDVGKSVPFLCSKAIDKWCNLLDKGILECLGGHLLELEHQTCRDAVVATQHVVARSNTQRASVTDPLTGTRKVNVPSQKQTPQQREATVDAKLGISPATTAPGVQQQLGANIDVKVDHDHPTSGNSIDIYKADVPTKDGATTSEIHKADVSSKDSADSGVPQKPPVQNAGKSQTLKNMASTEAGADRSLEKEPVLVTGSTLAGLLFVAGVSLALLRSQQFTKLLAMHRDPAVGVPLIRSCTPGTVEVERFVVAPGMTNAM